MGDNVKSIREKLEIREDLLCSHAKRSSKSSRVVDEPKSDVRTEFQRDRDRIIHSNVDVFNTVVLICSTHMNSRFSLCV